MITFIPRDKVSKNWIIIAPILSIVFTIFFGLLIFTFLGYNPLKPYIKSLYLLSQE